MIASLLDVFAKLLDVIPTANEYRIGCDKTFFGGFVLLALIGLVVDRDKLGTVMKKGSLYGFGAGVLNGAKNFLTLVIYLYLPLSIISPVKMGLGLVGSFAIALLFFKEKYTKIQLLGVVLGGVAIILLTI